MKDKSVKKKKKSRKNEDRQTHTQKGRKENSMVRDGKKGARVLDKERKKDKRERKGKARNGNKNKYVAIED